MNNEKKTLSEQDKGGYLRHNECDGLIITVGHKDQVSSSCITLSLLTSLPVCECAQFRSPSSREQTHLTTHQTLQVTHQTLQISLCFSLNLYQLLNESQTSLGPASPYSCYLDQNAGVWTATGLRTFKPRRRRI